MKMLVKRAIAALALAGSAPTLLPGCDNAEPRPVRSRVQAVTAKPGPGEPGAASDRAGLTLPATAAAPAAKPTASQARPPICKGQLSQQAAAFAPTLLPERRGGSSVAPLPKDPLTETKHWTWVNFWAAWCGPCKQELPLLLRWQDKLEPRLRFVFVSMDDDPRQLATFLDHQPDSGLRQTYWLPEGKQRTAWLDALALDTEPELPLQLLLDPKGNIRCRIQGAVEAGDLQTLEALLSVNPP